MNKSILALLIGVAFSFSARAQSNYKNGYVVTTKGDTLKGYINYREWSNTPKFIEFKPTTATTSAAVKYTPGMVQGFAISGMDRYITYTGRVSMDKNSMPDLPTTLDTTTVQDTLFLQVAYAGTPVSLLKQNDQLKMRFFVMEKQDKPVELIFHSYITEGTAGNTIRGIDIYKPTLKELAEKYKSGDTRLIRHIDASQFQEWELYNLVKQINNDQTQRKQGNYGTRFFAGILFKNTTTKFEGQVAFNGQSQNTYIPAISAGIDLFTNKHVQQFFFRTELSFTAANPKFNAAIGNPFGTTTMSYEYRQYIIAISPQLFFNFYNKDNFKVFAGAGVGINHGLYSNKKLFLDGSPGNPFDLEKTWINFIVQTGVTINRKFDVYATYLPASAISNYIYFSVSNTTYGAGLRYHFN